MRLRRSLALAGLLAFAPLTFSADGAVQPNEACAFAGSCCAEAGSTCVVSGKVKVDAYYSKTDCMQQQ
jgi:hypothetical protein